LHLVCSHIVSDLSSDLHLRLSHFYPFTKPLAFFTGFHTSLLASSPFNQNDVSKKWIDQTVAPQSLPSNPSQTKTQSFPFISFCALCCLLAMCTTFSSDRHCVQSSLVVAAFSPSICMVSSFYSGLSSNVSLKKAFPD
jgi:hypothetical protein